MLVGTPHPNSRRPGLFYSPRLPQAILNSSDFSQKVRLGHQGVGEFGLRHAPAPPPREQLQGHRRCQTEGMAGKGLKKTITTQPRGMCKESPFHWEVLNMLLSSSEALPQRWLHCSGG